MITRQNIGKHMAIYVNAHKKEMYAWRINKCGGKWSTDVDKEFAWRLVNGVPLGLGYKEAREWVKKRKK